MQKTPGPNRDRFALESVLLKALSETSKRHRETSAELLRATSDTPHDSHSDGMLLIKQASEANRRAREEYRIALQRFTDFVAKGIIPDDLKQS